MIAATLTTTAAIAADVDGQILDYEQQIAALDSKISPLRTKTQKKLRTVEKKLKNCNLLIDSGIGSKDDKAALRKTKRELRDQRIELWALLEELPELENERNELKVQLQDLRRRHGIVADNDYNEEDT